MSEKYLKISQMCSEKEWEDESEKLETVSRISESVEILNDEQKKQFYDLFKKLKVIPSNRYYFYLKEIVNSDELDSEISAYEDIVLIPIIKKKDLDKSKSGDMVCHPFSKLLKKRYSTKKIDTLRPSLESIKYKKENSLAIFVDDFIGTGKSALDCVAMFSPTAFAKVIFVSIAVLEAGRKEIELSSKRVYFCLKEPRAFDDSGDTDFEEQKNTYKKICTVAEIAERYQLGFNNSQALIKMLNTPNNTLGIFWWDTKKWKSPYPRIS
jgi:hypothetical protein